MAWHSKVLMRTSLFAEILTSRKGAPPVPTVNDGCAWIGKPIWILRCESFVQMIVPVHMMSTPADRMRQNSRISGWTPSGRREERMVPVAMRLDWLRWIFRATDPVDPD